VADDWPSKLASLLTPRAVPSSRLLGWPIGVAVLLGSLLLLERDSGHVLAVVLPPSGDPRPISRNEPLIFGGAAVSLAGSSDPKSSLNNIEFSAA
jgi:hypothetical protein